MDKLKQIFDEQRSLMTEYEKIEEDNGQLQTADIPVDLDDRFGQARLKDFAWRITEEIGETMHAVQNGQLEAEIHEEVSDVLHFMSEYSILAGLEVDDIIALDHEEDTLVLLYRRNEPLIAAGLTPGEACTAFISSLSMANNQLKNKPWKRSTRSTNRTEFYHFLRTAWLDFILLARTLGVTDAEYMHRLYFRKAQINADRQENGY